MDYGLWSKLKTKGRAYIIIFLVLRLCVLLLV